MPLSVIDFVQITILKEFVRTCPSVCLILFNQRFNSRTGVVRLNTCCVRLLEAYPMPLAAGLNMPFADGASGIVDRVIST